jgi:ADP-ribose pyrophosphatase YjhB (NUDIX family)
MKNERFKIGPYVSLILRKDKKILLIRRFQTGVDDGLYGCAGGGVDGNEPITEAIIREAREELGIILKREHLRVAHIIHSKDTRRNLELVGFYIEATVWEGEPENKEPHKCDDIAWFDLEKLPENTQAHLKHVLENLKNNIFYSEFGWD